MREVGVHESTICAGLQQYQILREEYDIPYQNYGEVEDQPARSVVCRCACQICYSHSYKNSTPCGQTAGGDRTPRTGARMVCSTHAWASERGAVSLGCGPLNGPVSPGREQPDYPFSQITSPLNGPVNYLKSLNAVVCEFASSVGRELRAHSGLRRIET